jgi:enoyl-CoA hydratase/carnithine racemase
MEPEILFKRAGKVAEITLNRPDKGNAMTRGMVDHLASIAAEIETDRSMKAVVIRARGKFFCTGGDIAAWGALTPEQMSREWILPGIDALERIAQLPQPVIAAISGHAIGGGLELAMAADLRIAVRSAKLSAPEVALGMISGWMGVRRAAELSGVARARELMLLGMPIDAEKALDWGLLTAVADGAADMDRQIGVWLDRLCANSSEAMALTKGILGSMRADLRHHHASAAAQAAASQDCREGVRAFLGKRKPVFE